MLIYDGASAGHAAFLAGFGPLRQVVHYSGKFEIFKSSGGVEVHSNIN
jgi:hypothetical protein